MAPASGRWPRHILARHLATALRSTIVRHLLVIVPALNEEGSIASVVADTRSVLGADVLVVDDGSRDRTAELARGAGATVLVLPFNLGVGGAIRAGLRYATEHGYDAAVQLDGDGQHGAAMAKRLLARLDAGDVDLVIGSRFAEGYKVGWARRMIMRALSRLISRRLGSRVTDTTSGFRAMGHRAVAVFARDYPVDYLSDTVEALLLAGDAGLRVAEVDVQMRERQAGVPSASALKSAYHLVRLLLVVLIHAIRPKEQRRA